MPSKEYAISIQPGADSIPVWSTLLSSSLRTLRQLAGATEREFLQIGTQMQGIYQRSTVLSQTAHQLAEAASGERIHGLIERLRQIFQELESFLGKAKVQSSQSCTTLNRIDNLLKNAEPPLQGVKKMTKHLYMLEVTIKIESAHLGDMGSEFINLSMDIRNLSQQIKDKVSAIYTHRAQLTSIITKNSTDIHSASATQDFKSVLTLENAAASLSGLESGNDRFSHLGSVISAISEENANNISGIVQSMQFHDIYRQQVEHVIEALEGLLPSLSGTVQLPAEEQALVGRAGDVCELQEAQLQFASEELYTAVTSIVDNLHDIGIKQNQMAQDIYQQTGTIDASGSSFIEGVSREMSSIIDLLTACAGTNSETTIIMKNVSSTVQQITGFVADIEEIGHDIIQIALNARIKAASAGTEGATMSVLAEEIGQLSNETVHRTDVLISTLTEIDSVTETFSNDADSSETLLAEKLTEMKEELGKIMGVLREIGDELVSLFSLLQNQVSALTKEIDKITGSISVHERTKNLADEVVRNLQQIFGEARALYTASEAFKEDLRLMTKRYTMESERRIHEDIARKHGVGPAKVQAQVSTSGEGSEFGENVDLF
jgi:methyl-accepting chemotaxis protein